MKKLRIRREASSIRDREQFIVRGDSDGHVDGDRLRDGCCAERERERRADET